MWFSKMLLPIVKYLQYFSSPTTASSMHYKLYCSHTYYYGPKRGMQIAPELMKGFFFCCLSPEKGERRKERRWVSMG